MFYRKKPGFESRAIISYDEFNTDFDDPVWTETDETTINNPYQVSDSNSNDMLPRPITASKEFFTGHNGTDSKFRIV